MQESDSDDNCKKSTRSSAKRRQQALPAFTESSSDDGEDDDDKFCTPSKRRAPLPGAAARLQRRSSERLKIKQQLEFQMPSRKDVWDKIPVVSTKNMNALKPRKLINNFISVTNYYNYDPLYTSGEEELEVYTSEENLLEEDKSQSSELKSSQSKRKKNVIKSESHEELTGTDDDEVVAGRRKHFSMIDSEESDCEQKNRSSVRVEQEKQLTVIKKKRMFHGLKQARSKKKKKLELTKKK